MWTAWRGEPCSELHAQSMSSGVALRDYICLRTASSTVEMLDILQGVASSEGRIETAEDGKSTSTIIREYIKTDDSGWMTLRDGCAVLPLLAAYLQNNTVYDTEKQAFWIRIHDDTGKSHEHPAFMTVDYTWPRETRDECETFVSQPKYPNDPCVHPFEVYSQRGIHGILHPGELAVICEYLRKNDIDRIVDPLAGNGFLAVLCMCAGMQVQAGDIQPAEDPLCTLAKADATNWEYSNSSESTCLLLSWPDRMHAQIPKVPGNQTLKHAFECGVRFVLVGCSTGDHLEDEEAQPSEIALSAATQSTLADFFTPLLHLAVSSYHTDADIARKWTLYRHKTLEDSLNQEDLAEAEELLIEASATAAVLYLVEKQEILEQIRCESEISNLDFVREGLLHKLLTDDDFVSRAVQALSDETETRKLRNLVADYQKSRKNGIELLSVA